MKEQLLQITCLFLIHIIRISVADPVGACPSSDGILVTYLTDSKSCGIFYICDNGVPHRYSCPTGLHFSATINVCVYPQAANCEGLSQNNDNESTEIIDASSEVPEQTETPGNGNENTNEGDNQPVGVCPEVDGEYVTLLPHKVDCTKFYICNQGNPVVAKCQSGLLFNPILLVCDYPELAGCEDASSGNGNSNDNTNEDETQDGSAEEEQTPNTNEGESQAIGQCPEVDDADVTILPHQSDCAKFYFCSEGTPIVAKCPPGLLFNPNLYVCDYPELAGCESASSENGSNGNNNSEEEIPARSAEDEETESNGVANQVIDQCPQVDGEDVTLLRHETDCTKFYICNKGTLVATECSSGLRFNPKLLVCDYPELAGCEAVSSGNGNNSDSDSEAEILDGSEEDEETETNGEENQAVGKCPEVDDDDVTLVPHGGDCTKFYICNKGTPVSAECASGLFFNPILLVCDYPELAGCEAVSSGNADNSDSGSEDEIRNGEENQVVGECPEVNGQELTLLPHEHDCTKFYICNEGIPIVAKCPSGLLFNPNLTVCDYPELAGCKGVSSGNGDNNDNDNKDKIPNGSEEDEETPSNGGKIEIVSECPEVDGEDIILLPHENNCTKFYICHEGTPIVTECPSGLLFNPTLLVCDYTGSAGCEGGSSENINSGGDNNEEEPVLRSVEEKDTSSDSKESQAIAKCPEVDGKDVTLLPHETDCTKFYICNQGTPVITECQPGLLFNPILLVCDYSNLAGCEGVSSGNGSNNDSNSEEEILPGSAEDDETASDGEENQTVGGCPEVDGNKVTLLPHEDDCTKFYICNRGTPVTAECQPGLLFNPILLVCDYPGSVGCGAASGNGNNSDNSSEKEIEETSSNDGRSQAIGKCPEVDGELYLLPHAIDCTKFYICREGRPVVQSCPANLLFNHKLLICDWSENAGCA